MLEDEKFGARSLAEFVGQTEAIRRLTALVGLARRREEPLGHILLVGPDGYGKRTLAQIISRELSVNLRATSAYAIENVGDLAAIINDLDQGDIFFVPHVNRLRTYLVDLLAPTLRSFELDIIVGKDPGARAMRLAIKHFTLIGTIQKASDCPGDLLNSFDAVIPLQRYQESEMLRLTERLAANAKLSVESAAVALVARLADGNPGQLESLLRRLKLVEKEPISEQDAQEMLSVCGHGSTPPRACVGVAPADWANLSGIEFEKLITTFLTSIRK